MPAITIESLPTLIYEQLLQAVALHRRNLTQEIVRRLELSFSPPTVGTTIHYVVSKAVSISEADAAVHWLLVHNESFLELYKLHVRRKSYKFE